MLSREKSPFGSTVWRESGSALSALFASQNFRANGIGFRIRMSSSSGTITYGRLNARNLIGFCVWNSGSPKIESTL